jgi:hypothetical protein
LTPYDQAKRCRYFDNGIVLCHDLVVAADYPSSGYCKRGEKCWFLHKSDKNHVVQDDDDEFCSICFEKPAIYGLLGIRSITSFLPFIHVPSQVVAATSSAFQYVPHTAFITLLIDPPVYQTVA